MRRTRKDGKLKGKQPEPARRSIRRRAEGEVSPADLAGEYSVGRSTIHRDTAGEKTIASPMSA
ncbi:hypothetical protein LUW76_02360 [Actinomadura madurae]|uniref:hypothetical protein n=1 Tax=Actinomadura madurae TaxID=1993 RepID=UPI0020275117|nr:hypothetical protein [Actinomadura madurae]URM93270.1 hypothetical protein LUW76_02360 [Actinomadura madurae]